MPAFEDWDKLQVKREYAQLLRLHERLRAQLQGVRDELAAPGTTGLLHDIKQRTGADPSLTEVLSSVEEALRALKLCEADVHDAVFSTPGAVEVEGVPNLPAHLQRFLAERKAQPGFEYEVLQDEIRGWVIRWKEYTLRGTVRAFGQFYERPYAWIEE